LRIKFFDSCLGDKPAWVDYNPLILHVDREIWDLASLGEPMAKFIIAHEIGHLVLHDHHAKSFSDDPGQHIKFAQKEERAEWQANTFASYFLVPTLVLEAFSSAEDLARSCEVPSLLAEERFEAATEEKRRIARCTLAKRYTGEFCRNCGNFTVMRNAICLKCDTCGRITPCSSG
jgi:hypothetical protein